jgi:hypothetical protein
MAGPPSCYRNAGPAEERFGELARRYAAALDESDELAGAALEALDALGAEGMEALEAGVDGDSAGAPDARRRRPHPGRAPGAGRRPRHPQPRGGAAAVAGAPRPVAVARNEALIAQGGLTLKDRAALLRRNGHA